MYIKCQIKISDIKFKKIVLKLTIGWYIKLDL